MTVRPPKSLSAKMSDPLEAILGQDILSEKISALSHANKKLERALDELTIATDGQGPNREDADIAFSLACEALWHVLIQRELCGFNRHTEFLNEMNVPKRVRLHAGPRCLAPAAGQNA